MLEDGITYAHEHITINLSEVKNNEDCFLDVYNETVKELKKLYSLGVRNIIDVTNFGMGRNVRYVQEIARATNINIINSTGFYQEEFYPIQVLKESIETLSNRMIKDIEEGIQGTDFKANVIGEIGTSYNKWTDLEKKVFNAAVIAHKETGRPISTHTSLGTLGHEQVNFFLNKNIDLNKVVIGHVDLTGDAKYIIKMLEQGVYVEFDTIGKESYMPDKVRVEILKKIEEMGLIDRVLLSMDITRKSHLQYKNGLGYSYLLDKFVPLMQKSGIKEDSINKMLVENPKRFFDII